VTELLDRRLAAVVFTDMVGYTALLQTDDRIAVGKRDRYWRALESRHDEFGGTIVQRLGDGSTSMFPSSLAAVNAAVAAIQQELAPEDVLVRIGVHVGEVIVEPERLTGEAVNIAARIESFAVARAAGARRHSSPQGSRRGRSASSSGATRNGPRRTASRPSSMPGGSCTSRRSSSPSA